MVPDADLDRLYESTLRPRLEELEGLRTELRGYVVKAAACVGVPFVAFILADLLHLVLPAAAASLLGGVSFALIVVGVGVAGFRYLLPGTTAYLNYRNRFKHDVAAEVFRIVCPTAEYSPTQGIARDIFDEPGIFSTRGGYASDDRARGRIGATPFEAADVSRSYSTGGKNSRTVVVFRGLFFHLDFNKHLSGRTIVQPAGAPSTSRGDRAGLAEVTLEHPAFAAAFTVYASDALEARYILTPAMMERILSLAQRTTKPLYMAFTGSRAYLGIDYGRALFEPGIAETTSLEALREMAAQFALAEAVVEELDLNTRIWTKDVVDDSLLRRADDGPADAFDALAARGNVTTVELLKAAASGHGSLAADEADAAAPRPPDTTTRIEPAGLGTAVHYPLSFGFYLALVVALVCAAVIANAMRALPTALGLPTLTPWTAWIPEIPQVPAIVTAAPIPFGIGAGVALNIALLTSLLRVRRVEIGPDAVRIWRGLRPWPRTYARPLYGKVVRLDKAVYLGKSEGLGLVNASASPMLPEPEARWVATELRRAMRATGSVH